MTGNPEGRAEPISVPDARSPVLPWTVLTAIYAMLGVALFLLVSAALVFFDRSLATRPADLAGGVVAAMILASYLWPLSPSRAV